MNSDEYTNKQFMLAVGDGHTLNVVDWGNQAAKYPVVFLHGGPGGSIKDRHKQAFDPKIHRVIFFDQRGAGLSTPTGSLESNTTQDQIADISKIADRLKVDKFYLHGTSWGSTLALAYALEHPQRVKGLVLGGIFTGSKFESDWLDNGGFKTVYPEVWQAYLERTPKECRDNPSAYHFEKALHGTKAEQKASSYAYECLEAGVVKLDDRFTPGKYEDYDPSGMRIEMHYLAQGCFMPDRHILNNAAKLTMPLHIVQGRYDMVCPPATAYELYQKTPSSRIYWYLGGHMTDHEAENIFRSIFANI